MDEARVDPEEILRKMKQLEQVQARGHLKIFFGYAAGVGKTYAMLKAAQSAKRHGVDVVVGYVEPHARPDTAALLNGLEQLPTLALSQGGVQVREFDLDGALRRAPQLVLVDELAHTNATGCRHEKRYQDVTELLHAGIDVYTTVNVQHIESLNDMVAAITGISVRERIPDRIFDDASQVKLVDIEPEELIDRLSAGKIYTSARAQKALGNFFDSKNLIALREIALRRCADRVSRLSAAARLGTGSDYYTSEHILVCLSSSPVCGKSIRAAARMANAFKGRFTALFVETPEFPAMHEADLARLRENIHLAEQLGAVVETVYGEDIAFQIAEFARLSGISKLVMGRAGAARKYFWSKPSLSERLLAAAPNLDIYIIPDRDTPKYRGAKTGASPVRLIPADIAKSLALLVLATATGFVFYKLGFSESNIIIVYILGVLLTAVATTQRVYSLVSSVLSVLAFNFFFTVPRLSLTAYDKGYPVTFVIMFVAAFIASGIAVRMKRHARQAAKNAYRTKILLETNQLLQKGREKSEIVALIAQQLTRLLKKDIVFYLPSDQGLASPLVFGANGEGAPALTTESEKAVAAWVYQNNKHAGATTNTLGSAKCLYLAVRLNETVYGVVGIAMDNRPLDAFENSIVLSVLGECALALESENAICEREKASVLAKNEQLRANLLRSISHDLRTPLTSISGNAGILLASAEGISAEKKQLLYTDIYDDSLWLINLVENLLSVTRLEDGSMKLHLTAELLDEVIAEALRHLSRQSAEHTIRVQQQDDLLMAKMDARLIVQVVLNIVDNAIKYTPVGSEIVISTRTENGMACVEIADNGEGLSQESKEKIFDMFYTANTKQADSRRSLGLGLALCKSIVIAHGGEISVLDNPPHGTVFRFTLPIGEVTLHE